MKCPMDNKKNEKTAGTKEKRFKPGIIFLNASDWSL